MYIVITFGFSITITVSHRVLQGALWSSALCSVQPRWGGVLLWLGGRDSAAVAKHRGQDVWTVEEPQ